MLLEWRIRSKNDETLVARPLNPLAMLMGGGASSGKQTAAAYDREQLASMRNSYRIGCALTCFLHFKMKMMQVCDSRTHTRTVAISITHDSGPRSRLALSFPAA